MNPFKWLLFFLLLNIASTSYESPYQQRRYLPLAKQHVPEHDNEYVWFTRDVHENAPKTIERDRLFKQWQRIFRRKAFD